MVPRSAGPAPVGGIPALREPDADLEQMDPWSFAGIAMRPRPALPEVPTLLLLGQKILLAGISFYRTGVSIASHTR